MKFAVGDVVRYHRKWLQSVGVYTGDLPRAKGQIVGLTTHGSTTIAEIDWDLADIPNRVNVFNLHKLGTPENV